MYHSGDFSDRQPSRLNHKPARFCAPHKRTNQMKNILTHTLLLLCVFTVGARAQDSTSTTAKSATKQGAKRGPVFRATKEQINQAQTILKERGFYAGELLGKQKDATRDGLRKYRRAGGRGGAGARGGGARGEM